MTEKKIELDLPTRFVMKDEIIRRKDEERRKCIRSILYILELVMDKNDPDYTKIRKAVLDFTNDYDRAIDMLLEKVMV